MATKRLSGKGAYAYDKRNDFLVLKTEGRFYSRSLEFGNLVLDIDTKGFITGLRIFDATEVLKVPKGALQRITKFSLHTKVRNSIITVNLQFTATLPKKTAQTKEQSFVHRVVDMKLSDSETLCTVA